nr:unnamed protein product [Spirometra erinaceieuropaei]
MLTWLSALLCTAGCLLPYWLKGSLEISPRAEAPGVKPAAPYKITSHLGIFRRCVYPVYATNPKEDNNTEDVTGPITSAVDLLNSCGHYSFLNIPHMTWRVGLICLIISCVILFFITFFLFVAGFRIYLLAQTSVFKCCQLGLLVASLLTAFTCVSYPFGWRDNLEVVQICGAYVDTFYLGKCRIGWAYLITIGGSILALLATALPCLFPMHSFAFAQNPPSLPPRTGAHKDCFEMREGCFRLPEGYRLVSPLTQACTPWQLGARTSTAILSPQPSLGDSSTQSAQTSVQGISSMEASFTAGVSNGAGSGGNGSRAVRPAGKNSMSAAQTVLIPIGPAVSQSPMGEEVGGLTTTRLAVIQNGKLLLTPHTVHIRK